MESMQQLLAPFRLVPGTKIVVAVSGGVDSMVLLTLLARLPGRPYPLTVAHYNHQLRAESAAEAALVQAYAADLGVPVQTGSWPVAAHPATGVEAAARQARYAFLHRVAQGVGATVIMTAHHADDQAETVLFRLARSGASAAMSGIAPARLSHGVRLLRPLLPLSKAELRAYAESQQVPSMEDASNADQHFSRNHLRAAVIPALKQENPGLLTHVARFTTEQRGLLALAQPALNQLVARVQTPTGADWRGVLDQPAAVQALVLQRVLAAGGPPLAWATQQQVLAALATTGRRLFAVGQRHLIVANHTLTWAAASAAAAPRLLRPGEWHQLSATMAIALAQAAPPATAWVVPVSADPLVLRHRQPGDRLHLADGHHQLLRRWFINHKVPAAQRASWWVIAHGHAVVWCQGIAPAQLFQRVDTDILQPVIACRLTDEGVSDE